MNPFGFEFIHACILEIGVEFLSYTVHACFTGRTWGCNGKQTRCGTCIQRTKSSRKYRAVVTVLDRYILLVFSCLQILNRHTKPFIQIYIYNIYILFIPFKYISCHIYSTYMTIYLPCIWHIHHIYIWQYRKRIKFVYYIDTHVCEYA